MAVLAAGGMLNPLDLMMIVPGTEKHKTKGDPVERRVEKGKELIRSVRAHGARRMGVVKGNRFDKTSGCEFAGTWMA